MMDIKTMKWVLDCSEEQTCLVKGEGRKAKESIIITKIFTFEAYVKRRLRIILGRLVKTNYTPYVGCSMILTERKELRRVWASQIGAFERVISYVCWFLFYEEHTPVCACCKKLLSGKDKYRCGKCDVVYYCSVECQKKDWENHKKSCLEGNKKWINEIRTKYKEFKDHRENIGNGIVMIKPEAVSLFIDFIHDMMDMVDVYNDKANKILKASGKTMKDVAYEIMEAGAYMRCSVV